MRWFDDLRLFHAGAISIRVGEAWKMRQIPHSLSCCAKLLKFLTFRSVASSGAASYINNILDFEVLSQGR